MATKIASRPLIRCVMACALPLLILILPALAAPDFTVTVCPAGPPQCDYNAIQPAINATASGATILISAGTYTGQLILRSDVTLIGSTGPTNTIVTASASPIVSGSQLVSATVQGLGIQGQGISTSLGIDLVDSSIVLSNVMVSNLHGTQGITNQPHGGAAAAIRLTGTLQVLLINSTLQDITGGAGLSFVSEDGAAGGMAYGVEANGAGTLDVVRTRIQRLQGGQAGDSIYFSTAGCRFAAGAATGIETQGQFSLTATTVTISDFTGGGPCHISIASCPAFAGPASGVRADGGSVSLTSNHFENLQSWAGARSEATMAIRTANLTSAVINQNIITNIAILHTYPLQSINQPESPYCWPMPGSAVGIASANDQVVQITSNTLSSLSGDGVGGYAQAVNVQNAGDVSITRNSLSNVTGGSASQSAGIQINQASHALVEANRLEHIQGSSTRPFGYGINAIDGGRATGIEVRGVNAAVLQNNIIWSISGGDGNYVAPGFFSGGDGGDATGLFISQGMANVWNNVLVQTIPGAAGSGTPGITGTAVGLYIQTAEVLAVNNVLIDHGRGVSVTAPSNVLAGYNDLWSNDADYRGVSPGLGDIHANPWFNDTGQGDFHVAFNSPLIDAGLTPGAPAFDFDGQPRPLDGNGDGLARTDIGSDEYQLVLLNRAFLPIVFASQR